VTLDHVPDGHGGFVQRVGSVDGRGDVAGFDEFGERDEVFRVFRVDHSAEFLADE
jgi:hypothetical protein